MSHNLANRPQAERDNLELDKARWFIANQWLRKFPSHEIRKMLEAIEDNAEREDMRRRLNQVRKDPKHAKVRQAPNRQPAKSSSPPRPGASRGFR